ncbi:hypothetical protein L4D09_13145 [Photobacterium makurazakiensis]|uniref:hypothetical protein n=1 Tax=Photobacterium makurazakiensis TaxID=2910234 RepID=UPI003D0CCA2E
MKNKITLLICIYSMVMSQLVNAKQCDSVDVPDLESNKFISIDYCFDNKPLLIENALFNNNYEEQRSMSVFYASSSGNEILIEFKDQDQNGFLAVLTPDKRVVKVEGDNDYKFSYQDKSSIELKSIYVNKKVKTKNIPRNLVSYWVNGIKVGEVDYKPEVDVYTGKSSVCHIENIKEGTLTFGKSKRVNMDTQLDIYLDNGSDIVSTIEITDARVVDSPNNVANASDDLIGYIQTPFMPTKPWKNTLSIERREVNTVKSRIGVKLFPDTEAADIQNGRYGVQMTVECKFKEYRS